MSLATSCSGIDFSLCQLGSVNVTCVIAWIAETEVYATWDRRNLGCVIAWIAQTEVYATWEARFSGCDAVTKHVE